LSVDVATVNAGLVALLAFGVAFACWRAMLHTGNPNIRYIVAAFVLLGAKSVAKSYTLSDGAPESRAVETIFSFVDLAAIGLVAWPILLRRRDA
jgi:hypothetical protein